MKIININGIKIGPGQPIALIAGPCVIESRDVVFQTAEGIKKIAEKLGMPFIFKSSFLKDNRSSSQSYQGPGLEKGLEILQQVKNEFSIPVVSDIHHENMA